MSVPLVLIFGSVPLVLIFGGVGDEVDGVPHEQRKRLGAARLHPVGDRADRIPGMINGMHAIVFSPEAEKVRDFFADVIGLSSVDAGGGWLIFALPPAELAVHPADGESRHQLYLMCDDIGATLAELRAKGAEVAQEVSDQGWGLVAAIRLPDGTEFPIYQPRHPSPH
jgi:predicted enzyme related to lactoylglutathione lyase